MSEALAVLGYVIISIGLIFDLVGCIGLVRMPNVYAGLQSAAKCVTIGTCSILFGAFLLFLPGPDPAGIKALICIVFIALTTPTGAHAIARAAHKFGIQVDKQATTDQYEQDLDRHPEGMNK